VERRNRFILDNDNAGWRVHRATILGGALAIGIRNGERDAPCLARGQFLYR
jgi:hypothetical protein